MTSVQIEERTRLGLAELPAESEDVLERVGERAGAVDRGEADLWDGLRELGAMDLLTAPLPLAAELTHALARRCTASAFALWGHRSSLAYHEAAGATPPEGAADGSVILASGMAPAFKEEAGIGEVPLVATDPAGTDREDGPGPGPITVSGVLPWCSNLGPGGWVITPVRWEDGRRAVVRLPRDAAGVRVKALTGLTALDGTSSGVLLLDGVRIDAGDVLTRDLPAFVDRVRPAFLQIQTAMCLGLAGAALDAAEDAADDVARDVLREELAEVAADREALRADLERGIAGASDPAGGVGARELVRVRLEAALLTGRATRLEQKVVGGRGYALASETSRRAREAAFLPVQSPTETHLRHLLARSAEAGDRG